MQTQTQTEQTERTTATGPDANERRLDVVVIGGGAAGLGGALALARARRSVLVIDAGAPRNAPAAHVHAYLTREDTPPSELLAAGRSEVTAYGGEIVSGRVTRAERMDSGDFRIVLGGGDTVVARRLLVATGLVDERPDVPGLAELWGRDVLHCPYCHGWEVRDEPIGVLATNPLAVRQALLWRQWSDDVTLFRHTAPEPSDDEYEQLAARGIAVVDGKVTGLDVVDDRLSGVRLASGETILRRALVVALRFTARAEILTQLGLETTEQQMAGHTIGTYVASDPSGATEVPGVWVAGNVANVGQQVIGAAAAGTQAGAVINHDLVEDDTRRAVAARQHRGDPDMTDDVGAVSAQEHWDARYTESDRIWSGKPNQALVHEVADLPPGRALDLGCGEGADAVWLAQRGWQVTAVDISQVALERAASHAADADVGDRIDWQQHDLAASFPDGTFDLVAAQFLHSFIEMPREKILRDAAAAVAPGGVLLIVSHTSFSPAEGENPHPEVHFPTPDEIHETLELPEDEWELLVKDEHEDVHTGHNGQPGTRVNNTLKLLRRGT